MASLQINEFVETAMSPQERYRAVTLQDTTLSIAYLQNVRVEIVRKILALAYTPDKRDQEILEHASLTGQKEILDSLIEAASNAEQPVPDPSQQPPLI